MKHLAPILLAFISLTSLAQIPNADFENWSNGPVLDDWQTNSAPGTLPPWDPYTVRQSMDSYSGTYCADLFSNGFFKPYMETTFPVSAHPEKLSFWWKSVFAPCVNDQGFPEQDTLTVLIQLLDNGMVVDSGNWAYTGASTFNYQMADVFFTNSSAVFDSCRIRFDGGAIVGGCGIVIQATEFYVDEASLSFFPNSIAERSVLEFDLFPNPASTTIRLELSTPGVQNCTYRIIDPLGRIVRTGSMVSRVLEIDLSGLPSGAYTALLLHGEMAVSKEQFVLR